MAQDFHDLTGQVVAKVVTLANDLEDSLVKLLVQVVPPEQRERSTPTCCKARWSTPKAAPTW
jgi:chemotaxis protein CheZ